MGIKYNSHEIKNILPSENASKSPWDSVADVPFAGDSAVAPSNTAPQYHINIGKTPPSRNTMPRTQYSQNRASGIQLNGQNLPKTQYSQNRASGIQLNGQNLPKTQYTANTAAGTQATVNNTPRTQYSANTAADAQPVNMPMTQINNSNTISDEYSINNIVKDVDNGINEQKATKKSFRLLSGLLKSISKPRNK